MPGTVHIVDDDSSFRRTMNALLKSAGHAVTEHGSAHHFLQNLPDLAEPSCLLLDVQMPRMSGPVLHEKLVELDLRLPVIYVTGHGDIPMAVRAMRSGAEDFLTKPLDLELLFGVIERALARHREILSRDDQKMTLLNRFHSLTPREREVFVRVVVGHQNKQIAFELGITVRTIKAHRHRVMEKLKAHSLIELVSIARLLDLAPPENLVPADSLS